MCHVNVLPYVSKQDFVILELPSYTVATCCPSLLNSPLDIVELTLHLFVFLLFSFIHCSGVVSTRICPRCEWGIFIFGWLYSVYANRLRRTTLTCPTVWLCWGCLDLFRLHSVRHSTGSRQSIRNSLHLLVLWLWLFFSFFPSFVWQERYFTWKCLQMTTEQTNDWFVWFLNECLQTFATCAPWVCNTFVKCRYLPLPAWFSQPRWANNVTSPAF